MFMWQMSVCLKVNVANSECRVTCECGGPSPTSAIMAEPRCAARRLATPTLSRMISTIGSCFNMPSHFNTDAGKLVSFAKISPYCCVGELCHAYSWPCCTVREMCHAHSRSWSSSWKLICCFMGRILAQYKHTWIALHALEINTVN